MNRLATALAALLLLVAGLAPVPARADWANTRWNMTRAEIVALYPDAASGPDGMLTRPAPLEFAGVQGFEVKFGFDKDGLRVVVLPTDASFEELRSALTAQYGASVGEWGRREDTYYMLFFKVAGTGEDVWISKSPGHLAVSWSRPDRRAPAP